MKCGTRFAAFALAFSGVLLVAHARPALADDRLMQRLYNPNEVVRLEGKSGVQAVISFNKDETIENVAVGDSNKWQITPNKRADLLFVKPLADNARTNMTVVTTKRTYFFDLVASPRTTPIYLLNFKYPDEPKPASDVAAVPGPVDLNALAPSERAIAEGDIAAMPADPSALNFAWKFGGDRKLLPSRIYDDGVSTYLTWPMRTAVPAILILNEKGEEGPVNYAVRDNVLVIPNVPNELILRSGLAKATLSNQRPRASETADTPGEQAAGAAAQAKQSTPRSLANNAAETRSQQSTPKEN